MRKLYVIISEIRVLGDVSLLSELVSAIDMSMQNIAQATDQISERLVQGGATNKGKAYEMIVAHLLEFRDEVFESAASVNEMQGQIAEYQNKIMRFEGMSGSCSAPNPFLANYSNIEVESGSSQYDINEIKEIADDIDLYNETVYHHASEILRTKNEVGAVWQDAQYKSFAEFIDDYYASVIQAMKELAECQNELRDRLKELD